MSVNNPISAPGGQAGTTTTLGFYGATPVVRPAAAAQPAATASTNTTPFGYTTQAQADAIVTGVRTLIATLSAALGGNGLTA